VKLVHTRTDAPRELPEEWKRLIEMLREMAADIMATPTPFEPPPDRPPPCAPGQRTVHHYNELAEQAEAAERQVA
jgi:sugar phosphate isomerase/epimerase